MQDTDWAELAPSVALEVLGEPNKKSGTEWRWGNKGSFVLNLNEGTFYDFEADEGGGLLWFIKSKGLDASKYLKEDLIKKTEVKKVNKIIKSFTQSEMYKLKEQSEIYVRYTNEFCVMRFPESHFIKQKYAPFTKVNDKWFMKRPEGVLPIYLTTKSDTSDILVTEGEKAMLGAQSLWDGDVCCHHGGVSNWSNCDWSLLNNRNVYIWPDNDDAGRDFANKLMEFLEKKCLTVNVVKIPRDFNEKDDLYDAFENNYFITKSLREYIENNLQKKKINFELVPVSQIIATTKKPNWLIKDICEKDSVIALFGAAKSGKSFIAVDMAAHISKGLDWNGYTTKESTVVYLAGEGQRGIARRVSAWASVNKQELTDAPFLISNRGARLLDENDHKNLKDTLYLAEDTYGDIGMIFIDTLARNFGAGNENSTEDMNAFVERIDDLKDNFNACICLVHHTGHGTSNRARGSSVLPAAVDWEYKVQREDINGEMFVNFTQTLVKDGNTIEPMDFKFEVVNLPFDDATSGALIRIENEDKPRQKDLNDNDNKILEFVISEQRESDDPAQKWLRHVEILNSTGFTKNVVNKSLKKLVECNKLLKNDYGYQTDEFKDELF